jgi:methionine-S-sulfoxide reductase
VIRTRVGYTGGTRQDPTYRSLGDHTEAIEIDYDPSLITYGELLDIFWKGHDPTRSSWSRQYMAAAFYRDKEQQDEILASKERLKAKLGKVVTEVIPYSRFYLAEDYHQKYTLKNNRDLLKEFRQIYSDSEITDSTAAARVNGYLTGNGSPEMLREEIDRLGLSEEGKKKLLKTSTARR